MNNRFFPIIPIIIFLIIFVEKFLYIINPIDWRIPYLLLIVSMFLIYKNKTDGYPFSKVLTIFMVASLLCCFNAILNNYITASVGARNYALIIGTCLMYKPLCCIVEKEGLYTFESTIILMGAIVSSILLLQGVLNYNILSIGVDFRDGFRTILGDNLMRLSSIFVIDRFLNKKGLTKVAYFILASVLVYSIFYIGQTRSVNFTYLVSVGLYIYVSRFHEKVKDFFGFGLYHIFLLLTGMAISLLLLGYVMDTVAASIELEEGSSIQRQLSYEYYWNIFKNHLIFGVGLIENVLNTETYEGVANRLFKNDIGIVGFIAEFGLCGILAFVYMTSRIVKELFIIKNVKYTIIGLQFLMLLPFNFPLNVCDILIYFVFYLVCITSYKDESAVMETLN